MGGKQDSGPAINPYVDDSELLLRTITPGTPSGTVDTAVLRFNTAIRTPRTTGINPVTTAENGTIVEVWRPGIWLVCWQLSQTGDQSIVVGISVNATNLTGDPLVGAGGIVASSFQITPVGAVTPVALVHPVAVSSADIRTGVNGRARLRMHGTTPGGAPIVNQAISSGFGQIVIRYLEGLAA
jgi:hypothetical protein